MQDSLKYCEYFNVDEKYFPCIDASAINNGAQWETTYPHATFISLLETAEKMLGGLTNRSLWIHGAYGTGKSQCAYALKKILEVPEDELRAYWNKYEPLNKNQVLLQKLLGHREEGIVVAYRYASGSISTPQQLFMAIQESVQKAVVAKRLDKGESLQWPCKDKDSKGTAIMHANGPVRGRALLYPAEFKPSQELPDDEYPLILMTGRILYQYNAAAMTARSSGLVDIAGEGFIEMNFADADRLNITNGEEVRIVSRRGDITAKARVGRKVSEGETWMPFHFPDSPVNVLTNAALDDLARIPEYKVCAVRVEKI